MSRAVKGSMGCGLYDCIVGVECLVLCGDEVARKWMYVAKGSPWEAGLGLQATKPDAGTDSLITADTASTKRPNNFNALYATPNKQKWPTKRGLFIRALNDTPGRIRNLVKRFARLECQSLPTSPI